MGRYAVADALFASGTKVAGRSRVKSDLATIFPSEPHHRRVANRLPMLPSAFGNKPPGGSFDSGRRAMDDPTR